MAVPGGRGLAAVAIALAGAVSVAGCGATSAKEAGRPTPSAAASSKASKHNADRLADGQLVAVTATSVSVHTKRGDQVYPVQAGVKVSVDGAKAALAALKPGMRVTLFRAARPTKEAGPAPSGNGAATPVARIVARSVTGSASSAPTG